MIRDTCYVINMNKPLKILLATNGLIMLASAMLGPIYAIFVEEVGGDILTASTAWAIYLLVVGVVIFLLGKFEDKLKEPELMMVWGYAIMAFAYLGYLMVDSPAKLFVIQIIIGLGSAIYTPAFDGIYSTHLNRKKSASQWSAWESMYNVVSGLGAIAGGLIATYLGFPALFVLMFLLCLISALFILFLPRKVL